MLGQLPAELFDPGPCGRGLVFSAESFLCLGDPSENKDQIRARPGDFFLELEDPLE